MNINEYLENASPMEVTFILNQVAQFYSGPLLTSVQTHSGKSADEVKELIHERLDELMSSGMSLLEVLLLSTVLTSTISALLLKENLESSNRQDT